MKRENTAPTHIEVRGARANNLKDIDVDIPLNRFVAVCGVSGSGKSTLATDVLYAEGARRYLQALSTYTRRRIGQSARPDVERIRYLPSAVALRQRPVVPGIRSTLGTMSELLNILRLSFSRLGSHLCPNGHRLSPSLDTARLGRCVCPECGVEFVPFSAEDFAFNSLGACPECRGTGVVEEIDESRLIADPNKSINEGAVAGWRVPGSFFYVPTAEAIGIPIDIPFKDLTEEQKDFVLHGKMIDKTPVSVMSSAGKVYEMKAQYLNAADAVAHAYNGTESEKIRTRLAEQFYHIGICRSCHGGRFAPKLLTTLLAGKNIAEVSALSLAALEAYAGSVPETLPEVMRPMARKLMGELAEGIAPLLALGLSYLSLDRGGGTLSTGELQRVQLARTLRSETTGVLYVLDEPSIGLHPQNAEGLTDVFSRLREQGNSLVVVDHDIDILRQADWLIEMGVGAGENGGRVIAEGTAASVEGDPRSVIGGYLSGAERLLVREGGEAAKDKGVISVEVDEIYTLKDVTVRIPCGKLTAVTGVSGSGKSTLILDCLVPAVRAAVRRQPLPAHVVRAETAGIRRVVMVDAVPVGQNTRSTLATYSGIMDGVRALFAATDEAQKRGWDAGHFSYNLKSGACGTCGGTGIVSLDIQYLPDMDLVCPDCGGRRYSPETLEVRWQGMSVADVLDLSVDEACGVFKDNGLIREKLESLEGLGLGYLKLGEATSALSGGEAQRMKLVSELGRDQRGTLFVFDEPTTGLHPQDIRRLLHIFDRLIGAGGTVVVIEHDLDMIANADFIVDMGPGGGEEGGRIVASGGARDICGSEVSLTGRYLRRYAESYSVRW